MIKPLVLNKWVFWWLLVAYCIISLYCTFIFIPEYVSGWDWEVFVVYIYGVIYIHILGLIFIANIITSFLKHIIKPKISLIFLCILLITHLTIYLNVYLTQSYELIFIIFVIQAYYRGRGDFYRNLGTRKNFFIKIKAFISIGLISAILSIPLLFLDGLIASRGLGAASFFYYFYLPLITIPTLLLVPVNNKDTTKPTSLLYYLFKIKWLFLYHILYYIYFFIIQLLCSGPWNC